MISQEAVNALKESPHMAELVKHMAEEAQRLDKISESKIEGATYEGIALEIMSRKRAYEILEAIVAPFLIDGKTGQGFALKEYIT